MEYKDIRKNLEEFSKESYGKYMDNDMIPLLSEEFDYIINEMKNLGKIVEGTN